jgi:hypothetical protein
MRGRGPRGRAGTYSTIWGIRGIRGQVRNADGKLRSVLKRSFRSANQAGIDPYTRNALRFPTASSRLFFKNQRGGRKTARNRLLGAARYHGTMGCRTTDQVPSSGAQGPAECLGPGTRSRTRTPGFKHLNGTNEANFPFVFNSSVEAKPIVRAVGAGLRPAGDEGSGSRGQENR